MSVLDPLRRPYRFREIHRRFGQQPFRLLDVGAGNHSASVAKLWFPHCHYAGIDRDRNYHNDAADFAAMDEFFELDLTQLDFSGIPDASYDVLLLAHVIEHLENGDDVLHGLVPKLAPGGMIYVEFPGPQSLHFPSKKGTLNFHDDDTHVRVFDARQVAGILRKSGMRVVRAGTRRTGALTNSYVMTACPAEDVARIVEAIRPVLERFGGVALVTDALWVRN